MRKVMVLLLAMLGIFGCSGGGGGGGNTPPGARREAVEVTLTAQSIPAAAVTAQAAAAAPAESIPVIEARATNVGNVTVRGFVFTHYDGGGGNTSGEHNLLVCQKCFDFKDNTGLGGCNYIFHCYEEENCDFATNCQEGRGAYVTGVGWTEHAYMPEGAGYCDNAAEHPELDCTQATWRVLTVPIFGNAGGGGKLAPGESMVFGASYTYSPGTYSPSAAVYRWDGTLFDNDAKTFIVQ